MATVGSGLSDAHGDEFSCATLDLAEWDSGQIRISIQTEWWAVDNRNPEVGHLDGRTLHATVTPR